MEQGGKALWLHVFTLYDARASAGIGGDIWLAMSVIKQS